MQEAHVALEGAARQATHFCRWWGSYGFFSAEQLQQLSAVLHWRGPDAGGRMWLVISNKLAVQLACQRGQEYVAKLLVSAVSAWRSSSHHGLLVLLPAQALAPALGCAVSPATELGTAAHHLPTRQAPRPAIHAAPAATAVQLANFQQALPH